MTDTKPRRKPKRRTGEEIVAAILDAASDVIAADGLKQTSTNAIAKRAGVSIGSLYQYFPNKESVVAAVTKRLNDEILARLRAAVALDLPAEQRLDHVLDAFCKPDRKELELRRALLRDVPRAWEESGISSSETQLPAILISLAQELAGPTSAGVDDQLFAAVFAVRGAVQGALLHRQDLLESGRMSKLLRPLMLNILRG